MQGNVTLDGKRAVGEFRIDLQAERGAANGIDGKDFK